MSQQKKLTEGDRASLQAALMAERGYALAGGDQATVDLVKAAQDKLEQSWPDCFEEICGFIRYLTGLGEICPEPAMPGSPT